MPFEDLPKDPSLADPLPASPLELMGRWIAEAREAKFRRNPTAMTFATIGVDGRPSARMVLCRGYDEREGFVVFYTDRRSGKGLELEANPYGAAIFHWDTLQRQIRLEGPVVLSPEHESDAYFGSRPRLSQIAAWASQQSQPLESRQALLNKLAVEEERFDNVSEIPRPPYWGGYRLYIEKAELWVGSEGRAHDRGLWTRRLTAAGEGFTGGKWSVGRLQP
jgi:pyridoxamine 5'-phosphate oxidase